MSLTKKGRVRRKEVVFDTDEGVRHDANAERLCKTEACFSRERNRHCGNSSQMSDGAAATVVMSADKAKELGVEPLARFVFVRNRRMFA
jgi:acetyl-CoA acyltransferase